MPVLAVNETQQIDAVGNLSDAFQITFTVENRPGSFTVTVPAGGDVVAAAQAAIAKVTSDVTSIYGL